MANQGMELGCDTLNIDVKYDLGEGVIKPDNKIHLVSGLQELVTFAGAEVLKVIKQE